MNQIKDLIQLAVHLSKGLNKVEMTAILELWEKAIAEVKNHFHNSDIQKLSLTTDNEVVVTVTIPPKRKRGRPRKDQSVQPEKTLAQDALKTESDHAYGSPQLPANIDNGRRTSKRAIVPSKRYPMLLSTITRPKSSTESQDADKENDINLQETKEKTTNISVNDNIDSCKIQNTETENNDNHTKSSDNENASDTDNAVGLTNESTADKCARKRKAHAPKNNLCGVCGKVFKNRSNLLVHMRLHEGKKPYSCSQCGKTFSVLSNKKRHEMSHSGAKPFSCPHCTKQFTTKRSLLIHLRQHTGERPYKCKYCEKRFSQTGTLQSHMHIHEGIKRHLCDLCGKSFRQRTQMMVHLLRHEVSLDASKKPFKCDLCCQSFVSKSDRDRHLIKHSGFRPFLCNLCPKSFTRMAYLKEHIRRHSHTTKQHGVPPDERKCKVCGFQNQNLRKFLEHMKKHEQSGEDELASAWGHLTSTAEGTEEIVTKDDGEETVIFVVDQSAVDDLYMENAVTHAVPIVGNESGLSDTEQHQVTLIQQGAIQVVQESQIDDHSCQTIVITEEQLAQLQHVHIFEEPVGNTHVDCVQVTSNKTEALNVAEKVPSTEASESNNLEPGEVAASNVDQDLSHRSDNNDEKFTKAKMVDSA